MPNRAAISWFKQHFAADINNAVHGTPFTLDMLTAIACQETGYIWNVTRRFVDVPRVLELCVGDTLDAPSRSAFPRTSAELESAPDGAAMFRIAHQALVDMAKFIGDYAEVAGKEHKFCRGYGIFQYDLQFFKGTNPRYFLNKEWADFGKCLALCIGELTSKQKKIGLGAKSSLTDLEMCHVAIAYNTGRFIPAKGLKQGHKSDGKFYGEKIFDFLQLAHQVSAATGAVVSQPLVAPIVGAAVLPPPTPITATGTVYEVDTASDPLNLRETPDVANGKPAGRITARLPDGFLVKSLTGKLTNGFMEVETSLRGGHRCGWAFAKFLKPAPAAGPVPVHEPDPLPPTSGVVAVYAPRAAGSITRRTSPANAHTLNEPDQPVRQGSTPADLANDLAAIIGYLAVDRSSHKRYQPGEGKTYCNIYMHDYCHLAGVYLPRVWWSQASVIKLERGENVAPRVGSTVDEVRANDLFRWLRDWGLRFGWRQTGSLTKLQDEVNLGAVGLIVARRVEDGRSGHIVAVVPETAQKRARRNGSGEVIAPLQSQAGSTNFQYGTGGTDWWLSERFAEHAFWIHA